MEAKAIKAKVSGRVQGVGFRFSTVIQARKLSLTGYVRNTMDGCVEVVAEGDPAKIHLLLQWLKKGSPLSQVTGVQSHPLPCSGSYRGFNIDF